MDWFSFWFNGIAVVTQGSLQIFFAGYFTDKKVRAWHVGGYLLILFATMVIHSSVLVAGVVFLALYAVNRFFLDNSRQVSGVTAVLAVYIAWLSSGISNSLSSLLFPPVLISAFLGYLFAWGALLVTFILCFSCYWFIVHYFSLRDNSQESYVWMLLPPGIFFFAVELYIFNYHYGNVVVVPYQVEVSTQLILLTLQMLGLAALFCSLYAYKHTCDGLRAQAALVSLAQETQAQKTYVTQAQIRYERTQAFRHDIKNHLSVLDGLLKCGNIEHAQNYLQRLEAVTGELSFPVHTGSPVVDVLLGDKLELARASGIAVDISLMLPNPCTISALDWCVIFANALDNAIRACMQFDRERRICISGEQQGDFYMVEFENTSCPEAEITIGTGLANIKTVAEKYNGAMSLEQVSSVFHLHVLLNISIQPDDHSIHNT